MAEQATTYRCINCGKGGYPRPVIACQFGKHILEVGPVGEVPGSADGNRSVYDEIADRIASIDKGVDALICQRNQLSKSLKRLLECPALNLDADSLEDEDLLAIRQAHIAMGWTDELGRFLTPPDDPAPLRAFCMVCGVEGHVTNSTAQCGMPTRTCKQCGRVWLAADVEGDTRCRECNGKLARTMGQ